MTTMAQCPLRYLNRKAPKRTLSAALIVSVLLHTFVCVAGVMSKLPDGETKASEEIVKVNIVSISAPQSATEMINKKEIDTPRDIKSEFPSEKEEKSEKNNKPLNSSGVGGYGDQKSNIIPVLTDANYVKTVPPVYPRMALERGQEGKVVLRALISEDGKTQDVVIYASSGFETLDKAAINAVSRWDFSPAIESGKKLSAWVEVPVEFVIR
jgi:TonB family protein